MEELYKKKNKNIHGGSLTSRTSNNVSKKKNKKINNIKEINFYNAEKKMINKKKKQNSLLNKKEGNPVKIKKMYDNIKINHLNANKSQGIRMLKKK